MTQESSCQPPSDRNLTLRSSAGKEQAEAPQTDGTEWESLNTKLVEAQNQRSPASEIERPLSGAVPLATTEEQEGQAAVSLERPAVSPLMRRGELAIGCLLLSLLFFCILLNLLANIGHFVPKHWLETAQGASVLAAVCWLHRQQLKRWPMRAWQIGQFSITVPPDFIFNRQLWYALVWGLGVLLVLLVRRMEPEMHSSLLSGSAMEVQVPHLLWVRSNEVVFIDRDRTPPHVMRSALLDKSLDKPKELEVPGISAAHPVAACLTADDAWIAAIFPHGETYHLAIWEPDFPKSCQHVDLDIPRSKAIGNMSWWRGRDTPRHLVFLYGSGSRQLGVGIATVNAEPKPVSMKPRESADKIGAIDSDAVITSAVSSSKKIADPPFIFEVAKYPQSGIPANASWLGRALPRPDSSSQLRSTPRSTYQFVAGVRCGTPQDEELEGTQGQPAGEGPTAVSRSGSAPDKNLHFLYLFTLSPDQNQPKRVTIRKQSIATTLDASFPFWANDGKRLFFAGHSDYERRNGWSNDIYDVSIPTGDLENPTNLVATLHDDPKCDAARFPVIIDFDGYSYLLFVTAMTKAGDNLWAQRLRNGKKSSLGINSVFDQLTDNRQISARPVAWAESNHLYIALVDGATVEGETPGGYRLRVVVFNRQQWRKLFPVAPVGGDWADDIEPE